MPLNFSCLHTKETLFTNRLYVGLNQDKSQMEKTVFSGGKEKKGIGMTEYGNILGRFLNLIGIAFKTKDENGNDLYINKKSFCNLIDRLKNNNHKYNYFNAESIDSEYKEKKDNQTQQRLKKIYNCFDTIFPSLSDKNIGEVAIEMLSK